MALRATTAPFDGRLSCNASTNSPTSLPFEVSSKRRKGYPSETHVKRGLRLVRGGEKELVEKLGRRDLCPCGSGQRFQALLH
jgi:SEC-C motif